MRIKVFSNNKVAEDRSDNSRNFYNQSNLKFAHFEENSVNPEAGRALNAFGPIYVRETPQCAIRYENERTHFGFTILVIVLFFPIWFLWLPALIASKKSQLEFMNGNYFEGKKLSKKCLWLNIICVVVGIITYGIIIFLTLYLTLWKK
jgi:hypothetical protein